MRQPAILVPLTLLALAAGARAQSPCYAENDGPDFNDGASMGNDLLLAIRFQPPTSLDVTGAEVFTGEGAGTNTLAIWSEEATTGEPDASLADGSWSMDANNSWQGTSLSATAALAGGTTYFVVWGPVNSSQASVDLPMMGLGQPYYASFDGGNSWIGPFQFADRHWKFRLFGPCGGVGTSFCPGDGSGSTCPCGNDGSSDAAGCANSSGAGCALVGSGSESVAAGDLVLSAANAIPGQPGLFFQGEATVNGGDGLPFGDGLRCAGTNVVRLEVVVPDAGGDASSSVDVAATGGASPGDLRTYQYWYRDPGGSPCGAGFNLSNGLELVWLP